MDFLEQYKQQNPPAFQKRSSLLLTDDYGRAYSGMITLAMRFSGGRIKNTKEASYVLLVFAGIIMLVSFAIFFWRSPLALQAREKTFLNQGKSPESYDKTLFSR